MIEDTIMEVTKRVRQRINSADVDANIKELLIDLIQFETRNMHKESSSYTKDYEKLIQEFM